MSTPLRERPDAPLGTLIFRAGLLPAETIENALEEGVKTGRRLGEILIERGLLAEEDLTRLLAGQKGLPFVSLHEERIDPQAVELLTQDQARLFSALPLRLEEGVPLVAVADPTNDVLNRNIREALGQDVRFVVAGRTELNDVIGEAYSGSLAAFATPAAEPFEGPPLRVDTGVEPVPEEAPADEAEARPDVPAVAAHEAQIPSDSEPLPGPPAQEETPAPEPELPYEPEPAAVVEPERAAVIEDAQPPSVEPETATVGEEAQPAVVEPAAAVEPEPEAAPLVEHDLRTVAAEPVLEPVAMYEEPSARYTHEPSPLSTDEPTAAPVPEPVLSLAGQPEAAPPSIPETNGHLPQEADAPLIARPPEEPALQEPAVQERAAAATAAQELPVAEHVAQEPAATEISPPAEASEPPTPAADGFTVFVRLTSGERLTVADCADIGEAKGYAKALTKQLGTTDSDDWPFVNGRFLKPDTIVSVDVEPS